MICIDNLRSASQNAALGKYTEVRVREILRGTRRSKNTDKIVLTTEVPERLGARSITLSRALRICCVSTPDLVAIAFNKPRSVDCRIVWKWSLFSGYGDSWSAW